MDRMDKLPNNLQLTIYNLHGLWAPVPQELTILSVLPIL